MDSLFQQSDGPFINLWGDGSRVSGVFVGEPHARKAHWSIDHYKTCSGEGCSYCAEGQKPTTRFMLNFYIASENRMKVIEGGVTWFRQILRLREKYNLNYLAVTVERHGESDGPNIRYSIKPVGQLDSADFYELEQMPLHDLPRLATEGYEYDEPRIDANTMFAIVERLQALPDSEFTKLLEQFGVQRVYERRETDVEAAYSLLGGLAEYAGPQSVQAEATEVDSFA